MKNFNTQDEFKRYVSNDNNLENTWKFILELQNENTRLKNINYERERKVHELETLLYAISKITEDHQ